MVSRKKLFLPKLIFIYYYLAKSVLVTLNMLSFGSLKAKAFQRKTALMIEAGEKGWGELIELKELSQSATEYLTKDQVHRLVIKREGASYLKQINHAITSNNITHYMYDPRTGEQRFLLGMLEAFRISLLIFRKRIVPICILTDTPIRTWRMKCAIVSSFRGVVLTLMSPRDIHVIFPHKRIFGPMPLAISKKHLNYLIQLKKEKGEEIIPPKCVFTGALYEPRTSVLNAIDEELKQRGDSITFASRIPGKERPSEESYWLNIINSALTLTTANQVSLPKDDLTHLPHFIYRYLEVTAAGTVLVAQEVPGLERFFTADVHYIKYDSPAEAAEKISYYLNHKKAREEIAINGQIKASEIINAQVYWLLLDQCLGKYSLK